VVPSKQELIEFLNAANAVYSRTPYTGLTPLLLAGRPVIGNIDSDGFYAQAFKYNNTVIIAFEGISNNDQQYDTGSHAAGLEIFRNHTPPAFLAADAFYKIVASIDSTDPI
jgi:hypothetical protein